MKDNTDQVPEPAREFAEGGLIPAIIDYCLSQAPRPNYPIALAGAITIVSHLAARRYVTESGIAPNVYLVALANSGCGKDYPRKLNQIIARECGLSKTVTDTFASGAGLEDCLLTNTRVLCQYDEFDTLFRALKKDQSGSGESLAGMMLTLFGASHPSASHTRRSLARNAANKADVPDYCIAPHLSIFGTAIPQHFFGGMTERMMTNGLFSRLILIPSEGRPDAHPVAWKPLPMQLVDALREFALVTIGADGKPVADAMDAYKSESPYMVGFRADDAAERAAMISADWDAEYDAAEDESGRAICARGFENTIKLAMVFAISEDFRTPSISITHLMRAYALVRASYAKSKAMAEIYCAENDLQANENKIMQLIRDGFTRKSDILRRAHLSAQELNEVLETMTEAGMLVKVTEKGGVLRRRTSESYKLAD